MTTSWPGSEPHVVLDDIDVKMIDLLKADGRQSNRSMTATLGLKEAAVAARLKSLTDRNLIAVSTVFDWQRAGYTWDLWLYIAVEGRPVRDVAEELALFDTVASVQVLFGEADLIVHLLATDREGAQTFLSEDLAKIGGVHRVTSSVALGTVKFDVRFASLPLQHRPLSFPNPIIDVDDFDIKMLETFQLAGRRSVRHVARELGVSDSTVRIRFSRLEDAGLVRMFGQVDADRTRLLRAWAYIGVNVSGVNKMDVCRAIARLPEAIVVAMTTGSHDILVLAAAARRSTLLNVVLDDIRQIAGVDNTSTSEVIHTSKMDFRWAKL